MSLHIYLTRLPSKVLKMWSGIFLLLTVKFERGKIIKITVKPRRNHYLIDSQPFQMAENAKMKKWQTSLVVQWLGFRAFIAVNKFSPWWRNIIKPH